MARLAAAAGVTGARDLFHSVQRVVANDALNRLFRDAETGTDQRLVAGPLSARHRVIILQGREQSLLTEPRALLSVRWEFVEPIRDGAARQGRRAPDRQL